MKGLLTPFLLGYFLLIGSAGWLLLTHDKLLLQLTINGLHTSFLDFVMPFITWLGDGLIVIPFGIAYVLFVSRKVGWMILFTYLLSALLAQMGKHIFFPEAMRPYFYLKTNPDFHKIPDFLYYEFHSFPSGHTATAFAVTSMLALNYSSKGSIQILLLMLACLIGFSRTYLSQHFLVDVWAGSIIGILSSFVLWFGLPPSFLKTSQPYFQK